MNDELDERRLRRAVRGALDDIVAASPSAAAAPNRPPRSERAGRGPWLHIAAGLTAAAGVLGVVALANRDDESPAAGEGSDAPTSIAAPGPTTGGPATTVTSSEPTTDPAVATPTTDAAVLATAADGGCGPASVPPEAANVDTVRGDIDGDRRDDTVTLYSIGTEWRVHVTSSVRGVASEATIDLELGDAIETATLSLADIDTPAAIMVAAQGPNDLGIDVNFTFLTLDSDHCVEQWIYRNRQRVDEPFEWVALREPGHVTGMICEGEPGSRTYRLVDSEQNDDGSWRVINRILTHDVTRAEITFPPEETIADSDTFIATYGSIVNCA